METANSPSLQTKDHVEVSIFFQFDDHPYENRWEIWTLKQQEEDDSKVADV